MPPVLSVKGLAVAFGARTVVDGVSYELHAGQTLGVVGESGCGKSMTALALIGLVPPPGRFAGSVRLNGREVAHQPAREWRKLRGNRIAMIFQEPMTALNPTMPVGRQIAETLVLHGKMAWGAAERRSVALLDQVGIAAAPARAADYPHHLSGGMRQRAMIAMAIACEPDVLIADEPTTALDVTIQAQILDLLARMQSELGMAMQFISHNLAVVSSIADEIVVMYAGRIVEQAPADTLFAAPLHPYTEGLIATLPDPGRRVDRLPVIPGMVAATADGCPFAPRCPKVARSCREQLPTLRTVATNHMVACIKAGE